MSASARFKRIRSKLKTYNLSPLPRLHGHFVFFKLVTPVRVDLLIIMRFAGRCTTLRIDRDVVAAERISSQATVVTTSLSFRHAHDDQTLFCCLNVLIRPVNDRQIKGN